ncbi:coiled-coil domain-containing protein [Ewingella americana]|uniref:hypothetical protein n=1 Tax=Ewingella americana TaxID=41202 RepID=UPI0012AEAA37|nr:hypothetical protein [Ewingella americana]MRT05925.1 hypothetical protein [Ewingella americana]
MNHPIALNSTAGLRLNLSGLERPASKADVREKAFSMAVKDKLTAQIMECSNPQQREVLQRLCEDDAQHSARTMYSDIARMDSASPEFTHAVDRYVLQLKQHTLHDLERKLNAIIGDEQPPDLAKPILHSALADSRSAALQTMRQNARDNPFLATCIEEHICACDRQKKNADKDIFLARMPDIIQTLEEKAIALKSIRDDKVRIQKETLLNALQHIIDEDLQRNAEKIEALDKEICADEDVYYDAVNLRSVERDVLNALNTALNKDQKVDIPTHSILTDTMRSALHYLNELYTHREQTSLLLKNAEHLVESQSASALDQKPHAMLNQELALTVRAINAIKARQRNLETSMANRSGLKDFGLHIKRFFGGGKQEKKLSEYRKELRECTTQQQELDKQYQLLSKQLQSSEVMQQLTDDVKGHRTLLNRLHQQLDEQRGICLAYSEKQNELEETSYQTQRFDIMTRDEVNKKAKNELTNADEVLKRRIAGDRLGAVNFRLLCEVLSESPALAQVKQQYTQLQHVIESTTADSPEIIALRELKYACMGYMRLSEIAFYSLDEEFQSLYSRFLDNDLNPADIKLSRAAVQALEPAAQLYALLCVEKIERHALNERVARSEELTPRIMTQLDALNKEIEFIKVKKRHLPALQNQVEGLRRILTQQHDRARIIAEDFSAQFLHVGQDIYIDRQNHHGTCVMHAWNNIITHLSDNQQMQMTPWRMEKFIQSAVVGSAHQLLSELLEGDQPRGLSPAAVDQTLRQIIGSTELVRPAAVYDFIKNGYVMDYQGEPLRAEQSNLSKKCGYLFDSYGLRSESISMGIFYATLAEKERVARLDDLSERNFDALSIGVFPDSGSGHALALLKSRSGYLLVDSNHDEPIPVTLAQLEQYIVNPENADESLKQTFAGRDYDKYRTLVFETGFYKGEKG